MDTTPYYYREMGSRNKKTGKLSYYRIKVINKQITDCTCMAREFRPYTACKHMKNLQSKNSILVL